VTSAGVDTRQQRANTAQLAEENRLMTATRSPWRSPDPEDPRVQEFAQELRAGAKAIRVPKFASRGPFGNCYWNVDAAIKAYGGGMQLGWLIDEMIDSHLSAVHHAVWMRAPGILVDVTEDPSLPGAHITFVCDTSLRVDLSRPPNIQAQIKVLKDRPERQRYRDAYLEEHAARNELIAAMWNDGYRAEDNFHLAAGRPDETEFLQEKVQRLEKKVLDCQAALIKAINFETKKRP
jgi:hypothetical protein